MKLPIRQGLLLWAATVAAAALALPQPPRAGALALAALVAAVVVATGLAAREALGLEPAPGSRAVQLTVSLLSGALLGGALLALLVRFAQLEPLLRTRYAERAADPAWRPWVLALESSILEEVLFRLFLMTGIAWLATRLRLSRQRAFVVALIVSTLLFGAAHLPAWLALAQASPLLVGVVVLLNGLAGLLLGWIYWRWGILAAVGCHFAGDVVVQTLAPRLLA